MHMDDNSIESQVAELTAQIEKITAERDEYLNGWRRMQADVANREKHITEERSRIAMRTKESFVTDLLPVLDSFEAAFSGAAWKNVDPNWQKGVEYIYQQFMQALHDNGISAFGAIGDTYDPQMYDLADQLTETVPPESKVTKVIRKGYKTKDTLLRAATVSII
jgi:molecular chaperone GrpE